MCPYHLIRNAFMNIVDLNLLEKNRASSNTCAQRVVGGKSPVAAYLHYPVFVFVHIDDAYFLFSIYLLFRDLLVD